MRRRTAALATTALVLGGCSIRDKGGSLDASAAPAALPKAATAPERPGMILIPEGVLRAGTPRGRAPRIAEEEAAGVPVVLKAFYIDRLPYPNEAGGIPTTNVTRDDAARMCSAEKKRLCTELEWERACKGPSNSTYEYGDAYKENVCDTGRPALVAARRPSGERTACKSGFGVMELHGGAWEWTDSVWNRGAAARPAVLHVLRGGNAEAGEIVGRCANAIARGGTTKSPATGFRCCAGEPNLAVVKVPDPQVIVFERALELQKAATVLRSVGTKALGGGQGDAEFVARVAWFWRPTPNDELRIVSGCIDSVAAPRVDAGVDKRARCGVLVARIVEAEPSVDERMDQPPSADAGAPLVRAGGGTVDVQLLASIESGYQLSEVVLFGNAKRLRMWGIDKAGTFVREFGYSFGRVEVGEPKRH